jgi:trimeric autotransporter adhesin
MVTMKIFNRMLLASILGIASLGNTAWSGGCSPIVIDLGNNGLNLGQAGVGVYFDVNADGVRDHVQWTRRGGDEGFLAIDRSGNGLIDNGAELFGVGTPMILESRNAPNGFVGLAQYDSRQLGGNDDGRITEADAIWPQLRVWIDADADGISTSNEMRTLHGVGLTALDTIPRIHKHVDDAGNVIPYWAWAAQRAAPGRALMADVFFLVLPR